MLDEGRKRDAAANAILALSFAANAAQSPQALVSSGKVEAPGVAGMQRLMDPRKKRKDLDLQRVSHSSRNRKMKTFREFVEEAYLIEMRKEDKVAGKQKTPLYTTVKSARAERQPEGSDTKWKIRKSEKKSVSQGASLGRYKQGMIDKETNPYASRQEVAGTYKRHAHGGGGYGAEAPGVKRGVKKVPGEKKGRQYGDAPTPAEKVALRRAQRARSSGGGR